MTPVARRKSKIDTAKKAPAIDDVDPALLDQMKWTFSKEKSERAVKFIESLKHSGTHLGKAFKLLPWQRTFISDIFGRIREDGTRLIRRVYFSVPRKNGKSELAAAMALKALCSDGEPSPEVYLAANSREQAAIVFKAAKMMVQQSPLRLGRLGPVACAVDAGPVPEVE